MRRRLRNLFVKSLVAALVAWLLISAPFAEIAPHTWFAFIQVPLIIFLFICYIGKLLIDTFFYDRYQS